MCGTTISELIITRKGLFRCRDGRRASGPAAPVRFPDILVVRAGPGRRRDVLHWAKATSSVFGVARRIRPNWPWRPARTCYICASRFYSQAAAPFAAWTSRDQNRLSVDKGAAWSVTDNVSIQHLVFAWHRASTV